MPEKTLKEASNSVDHGSSVAVPVVKKKVVKQEVNWLNLPYELWLLVLVEYGLTATDLAKLEMTCTWFCWKGNKCQLSMRE